jgi:hypothetical protein
MRNCARINEFGAGIRGLLEALTPVEKPSLIDYGLPRNEGHAWNRFVAFTEPSPVAKS